MDGIERICLFSGSLPGWSALEVIELARTEGFGAIEWASGPGHAIEGPELGAQVRELCEGAALRSGGLAVQDPQLTLADAQRVAPQVDLAAALGAPHVRLLAPPYRGGSLRREQHRSAAGVDALVQLAAPLGLAVLVETAPATLAPSPELAAMLVEHHPPTLAGVLYDPGNMAIEGHLLPQLAIARLGPHLRHVHVKNIAWSRHADGWRWRHAPLGAGVLDWSTILTQLAAARYEGMFSIDHLGGRASPLRLRSERNVLRSLLAQAWDERREVARWPA